MNNKIVVVVLFSFLIPNLVFASWWNPFSWFKKQTVQPPVIQVSIPAITPTISTNDKQVEKVIPKKEKQNTQPISKKIIPVTSTPPIISKSGGGSNGIITTGPCPVVGPCTATPVVVNNNSNSNQTLPTGCNSSTGFSLINGMSCGANIAPVVSNTTSINSPSVVAIDAFLANPTEDNLKTFCTTAKTLPGTRDKKVFNDTRTDFVVKKNTLYDEAGICATTLGEYKNINDQLIAISWFTYNPLDIFDFNNTNESDKARKVKIAYNAYWKSLAAYKLIGFEYRTDISEIVTPKQNIENAITDNTI